MTCRLKKKKDMTPLLATTLDISDYGTDISPMRASPTRASPTRASPTRASPTRASPTRASPMDQKTSTKYVEHIPNLYIESRIKFDCGGEECILKIRHKRYLIK